jgi:hypothetical protein
MSDDTIGVRELQDYWKYVEGLKVGEIVGRSIGTREMPHWEEICGDLDWDLFRADDGALVALSRRNRGFCIPAGLRT